MAIPVAMHVPDGFLSAPVAIVAALISLGVIAYALRRSERDLTEDKVPMLGVIAAFIFAVQMLNFPVAGGTSGHLLGATLAAVLLGPWLACLVMSVVLGVQAFAFADGGIAALGANILNMGILGAHAGRDPDRMGAAGLPPEPRRLPRHRRRRLLGGGDGGGGRDQPRAGALGHRAVGNRLPAMLGVHTLIGIGEAVITVAAVSAVMATRPDLIVLGDFGRPPGHRSRPPIRRRR